MTIPAVRDNMLVQWFRWVFAPIPFLDDCANRYGSTFSMKPMGMPCGIFLTTPDTIEQVFTADPNTFDTQKANQLLRPLVGDRSVFLLDGADHERQRKLLMPPFHGESLRLQGNAIAQAAQTAALTWQQQRKPFPVANSLGNLSLEIILRVVFGVSEQRYRRFFHLTKGLLDTLSSPLGASVLFAPIMRVDLGKWSPWGRFQFYQRQIDRAIAAEIAERRAGMHHPLATDILTLLMQCRDEANQPPSDRELRDALLSLLIAGHETTATALTWALYWIHRTPGVLETLLHELNECDRSDPLSISRLPYLSAVCQEVLRLYPVTPITIPRILKTTFPLNGQDIRAGMALIPCIYLLHRQPDLYPQPHLFLPERFLNRKFSPYEYIPFGGGSRRCLGAAFALFEMKVVLATLLTSIRFELVDTAVSPIRKGVLIAPKGGVRMVAYSVPHRDRFPQLLP